MHVWLQEQRRCLAQAHWLSQEKKEFVVEAVWSTVVGPDFCMSHYCPVWMCDQVSGKTAGLTENDQDGDFETQRTEHVQNPRRYNPHQID